MLFQSLSFIWLFLPVSLLIYYLAPPKARNGLLFFLSLVFYGLGEFWYLPAALLSITCDYFLGRRIQQFWRQPGAKQAMILGILKGAVWLLLVKQFSGFPGVYYDRLPLFNLLVPLGSVVYTLKGISYLSDVYAGRVKGEDNFFSLGLYLLFFPSLPIGPCLLYRDFSPMLDFTQRKMNAAIFFENGWTFVMGLAKVVLISGNFQDLWQIFLGQLSELTALSAWMAMLCIALGLYFLWSGMLDMSQGISGMFGFVYRKTEDYPFMAKSLLEFAGRMDTALARWVREYAHSTVLTADHAALCWIINIILFFLAKGLFRGDWKTLTVWLMGFMLFLLLDSLLCRKVLMKLGKTICHVYTVIGVLFCSVVFALPNIEQLFVFFQALVRFNGMVVADETLVMLAKPLILMLVIGALSAVYGFFQKTFRQICSFRLLGIPIFLVFFQILLLLFCTAYLI